MMTSKVGPDGRVHCARPGCDHTAGFPNGERIAFVGQWHYLRDEKPPRWRRDLRPRLSAFEFWQRRDEILEGEVTLLAPVHGEPRQNAVLVPLPVVWECRCGAVQEHPAD